MLKVHLGPEVNEGNVNSRKSVRREDGDEDEGKSSSSSSRFKLSPRDNRGRRRPVRGRVGRTTSGVPGVRSYASNRAARRIEVGRKNGAISTAARALGLRVLKSYFGIIYKCASCVMGMFKWLRKDFVQWDRSRRNLPTPDRRGLNNDHGRRETLKMIFERPRPPPLPEVMSRPASVPRTRKIVADLANSEAYRSALQAFLDRRREPGEGSDASESPKFSPHCDNHVEIFRKNTNSEKLPEERQIIPGVPHVPASEVFEVGWVAGTEDRYLELISAEWQHTRTALRRSSHPDCFSAVRADLDVLTEIRHPHTLLLMGTTRTDEHGIVAIFESVDCTLYNYIHEQGERVSVQGAARCAGQLADALRHAHARGIVHGALSSHCVFLAASGTAKLGGWELAVRDNEQRPYREWEERLRTEIFRWQAPEMFYGDSPSRACDVYALALLIWEMCTGRVPWSGLNETEIERQYIQWECGVPTDMYNFPPLLGNLIEAGLQLNVNKRKLDMNRTRRFLRRLELRYEEEGPIYVDRHSNNNNSCIKTFNAPVAMSPLIKSPAVTPNRDSEEIKNSLMIKKLFNLEKSPRDNHALQKAPRKDSYSNKYDEVFVNTANEEAPANLEKKTRNVYSNSRRKNSGQEFCTGEFPGKINKREKFDNSDGGKRQRRSANEMALIDVEGREKVKSKRKNLVVCESSLSETSTATETPISSSDESANDTMTDLKKLKEILATKRSNFFYGSETPKNIDTPDIPDVPQASPKSRERILKEARDQSSEPRKPASHKINLEPNQCKSPTEYNPTLIKPASHQNQRVPQCHLSELKQVISYPQALNSSSSSFFETSLWRKEKLICMSKMRKHSPDRDQELSAADKVTPPNLTLSPKYDSTYVIDNKTAVEGADPAFVDSVLTTNTTTESMSPMQALKEALDRATEIICSVEQHSEQSTQSSPIKSLNNFEDVFDETGISESIFESLNRSKLGSNNADDEIKSIERSTGNEARDLVEIMGRKSLMDQTATESLPELRISPEKGRTEDKEKSKCVSFGQTAQDSNALRASIIDDSMLQPRLHDFTCINDLTNDLGHDANDSLSYLAEKSLISTAMIFLSNKSQEKSCKTCQHKNLLARRRSLPAGLGQFRSVGNSSPLGRLPIRRGEVPDSTVEDLYIDDEFGDNLNINMVLLEDDDESDSQDLLSNLINSSNA